MFTPPGRGASGKFALDVAVRTLELYDEFFMVPYPLPKLDMIAIMDFAMGAIRVPKFHESNRNFTDTI